MSVVGDNRTPDSESLVIGVKTGHNLRRSDIVSMVAAGKHDEVLQKTGLNTALFLETYGKTSNRKLAEMVGIAENTVPRWAKLFGLYKSRMGRNGYKPLPPCLHNKEWLSSAVTQKPITQIAADLGVCVDSVHTSIAKLKVDTPGPVGGDFELHAKKRALTIGEVKRLYEDDRWSTLRIAKHFGFVGDSAIRKFMRDNGITIRLDGEHAFVAGREVLQKLRDKKWLLHQYDVMGKSSEDIADDLNLSHAVTVQRWLRKHGATMREPLSYASRRRIGKPHTAVINMLEARGIKHTSCFVVNTSWGGKPRAFEIDEYLPITKTFIEVQGEHFHGIADRSKGYASVRQKMWADLIKYMCLTRDFPDHKVVYITESDAINGNLLIDRQYKHLPHTPLALSIANGEEERVFIAKHHYSGTCPPASRYYRAEVGGEIAAAVTVSRPSRQGTTASDGGTAMEIRRMAACEAPPNTLTRLLAFVCKHEKTIGTHALVTFSDPSPTYKVQHTGSVYRAANFVLIGRTAYNYRYVNKDGIMEHKKSLYNKAVKANMKEKDYATANGWFRIPEWPKDKYERILN